MRPDEFMQWHERIARLNSSSEAMAMAINPSLLKFAEMSKIISPPLLGMVNSFEVIKNIISPTFLKISQQASEISNTISPVVYKMAMQSTEMANRLSPLMMGLLQFAEKVRFEITPLIQQMEQTRIRWSDISSLSTNITRIIENNPYIEDTENNVDALSLEEKQEIASAVSEVISTPPNWQQNIVTKFENYKLRNPIWSKFFIWLLYALITIILGAAANVLADVAQGTKIKETPSPAAPIITNVIINQPVYIINEAPYYYEIEFVDKQSGETVKGWASKRSLKPLGKDDNPIVTEKGSVLSD